MTFRLLALPALLWLGMAGVSLAQVDLGVSIGSTVEGSVGGALSGVGDDFSPPSADLSPDVGAVISEPFDQAAALEAVRSRKAVPLAPIVERLQEADLQVLDAKLLKARNILLYQLRVISETGAVSELYFYARNGRQVEGN